MSRNHVFGLKPAPLRTEALTSVNPTSRGNYESDVTCLDTEKNIIALIAHPFEQHHSSQASHVRSHAYNT